MNLKRILDWSWWSPYGILSPRQGTRLGTVLAFLGWPCEFDVEEDCGCAYGGHWYCGHRRAWINL